jgi:DNA-binding response OmpR family regulator
MMSSVPAFFRILLLEDEPVIRELVRAMLGTPEVEVDCVSTGAEALKLAAERDYHLFLLDVVLPGMDGITVLRMLRAGPKTSTTPVYMLTAKQKSADIEVAKRAGATGYIQKPFKGSELIDLVAQVRTSGTPAQ